MTKKKEIADRSCASFLNYSFLVGYERDSETGLDYAQARYYASMKGRFTSPDPLYLELRRLTDPQQFNIYSYARNNPLKLTDPTGLDITVTGPEIDEFRALWESP